MKNSMLQKSTESEGILRQGKIRKSRLPLMFGAVLCLALHPATLHAENRFLKANGRDLRSDSGRGQVTTLGGVNLGSLSVNEQWMSPMVNSTSPDDQWGIEALLASRFGQGKRI